MEGELQLVEKAKTNCSEFQTLYRMYLPSIFNYCYNRVGNRHNAEDITSSVFLSALDKINQFDTSKGLSFKAWIFRIAHNKVIDFYKKHKPSSLNDLKESESTDSFTENVENKILEGQKQKEVQYVLSGIKPNHQQILTLKFFSELKNPEIAEIMDLKLSVLNNQLHRALESFEKKFKKTFPKSDIFTLSNRNN